MNLFLIFGLALMLTISSIAITMPQVDATEDFNLEYSCSNDFWSLKVMDSEGNSLSNVKVYLLNAKRELVRKYVIEENGTLDIPKAEMSENAKISKGGFADQMVAPNCYLKRQDPREFGDYMGGDVRDTDKDIIDFCDTNYEMYQTVGEDQFRRINEGTPNTYVQSCITLYQSNVYPYDGTDRIEYLINYVNNPGSKYGSQDTKFIPKIPDWVKNTMQWYLDGVISEDEMISAIQFLVKEGIIKID